MISRNNKGNSKTRSQRWVGPLLLILAVLALVFWLRAESLASGVAPPLVGNSVTGGALDLGALRGKPVLVHFWATWCPVCRLGDKAVAAIAEDFDVITVATQSEGPSEIAAYLRREALSFPVIPDPHGALATRWDIPGIPTSFILDRNGRIRFTTVGYTTEIGLRGRLWVAGLTD